MSKSIIAGVDVSKEILDYCVLPSAKEYQVQNNVQGIQKLVKRLIHDEVSLVVLEATGGYHNLLVTELHEANIPLKVVNPRQIRDFARSHNRLAKTDKLDAKTLAEFGLSRKLEPDAPKDKKLIQLSSLLSRRNQLQAMITMEKGHRENCAPALLSDIEQLLALFCTQLKKVGKEIEAIIASKPEYAHQDAIMQSICGIGPIVSSTIIAELPEIQDLNRKELAALVGVAPFNRDSGKYRGQRHIHAGRSKVRHVLYSAMRACLRYNQTVRSWFDKFIAKGKPYKVAVIACIRKLLVVIRAMLKSKTEWKLQELSA